MTNSDEQRISEAARRNLGRYKLTVTPMDRDMATQIRIAALTAGVPLYEWCAQAFQARLNLEMGK